MVNRHRLSLRRDNNIRRNIMTQQIQKQILACLIATSSVISADTVLAGTHAETHSSIPSVPVRVLRPDSNQTPKVDGVNRAVPATVDQIDRARRLRAEGETGSTYRMNENHSIMMKPGENVFIPIAVNHPNRILTPFQNPQVVSTTLTSGKREGECGEICVRDSVVYISTEKTYPVTAFITEKGREDVALSVTMMPRQIPPREVKLTVPDDVKEALRIGGDVSLSKAKAWETSQPYVETLRSAFRTIALQGVPQGYNLRQVKPKDALPVCKHPGLEFNFANGQILEGHKLSFYVGVIRNVADSPVEFREQRCGGWKVAAVTSWPLKVLKPGQKTEIYVAVKNDTDPSPSTIRKPLIQREYN